MQVINILKFFLVLYIFVFVVIYIIIFLNFLYYYSNNNNIDLKKVGKLYSFITFFFFILLLLLYTIHNGLKTNFEIQSFCCCFFLLSLKWVPLSCSIYYKNNNNNFATHTPTWSFPLVNIIWCFCLRGGR